MCGCVSKLRFSRIYNHLLRTLILIIFGFININNGLTSYVYKDTTMDTPTSSNNYKQQQLNIINQNLIMSHTSSVDTTNFMPKTRQFNNKENDLIHINSDGITSSGSSSPSTSGSISNSGSSSIISSSNSISNSNSLSSSNLNLNSPSGSRITASNSNNFGGITSIGGGYISAKNSNNDNNKELLENLNNNNNKNNLLNENLIETNQQQTDSSADIDDLYNTPMYFGTENDTVITTQIGATAHMPCTIHHIGDGVVTWIRRKDYHLLTVGLTTYNSDERFSATHLKHSEDWTLQIKFVQLRDAGIYECQVSTHPPTSIFLHLNVVEARAEISGPPIRYLTPGSTLRLQCRVLQNTQPSEFIFWYHDNRMINYDIDRGINVSTESDFQSSELVIQKTRREHSGNFTCLASNAQPASVLVHIFKGDNPAAMYHGDVGSSNKSYQNQLLINLLLFISISKTLIYHSCILNAVKL